jgi:hypothetical protein
MQTAAGVAAGALAFEGVESVLHGLGGFGHPGMGMGGFGDAGIGMGGGFGRPVEETVVNNYYDEPGGEHRGFESRGDDPHLHEPSDRDTGSSGDDRSLADDGMGFADQNANDTTGFDDGNTDDAAAFDGGGQDDGGGFDDGGGDNGGNDLI